MDICAVANRTSGFFRNDHECAIVGVLLLPNDNQGYPIAFFLV